MSDETTSSNATNDCAITDMVMGSLKRTVYTKTSGGKDTSYVTSIYGGNYPMYVDQAQRLIYNADSLPINTNVAKVLFSSISSDGTVAYRTPYGNDTVYSSTDTLDFTEPRLFTCYSYSGLGKRTYEVHVNVHKVDPERFVWYNTATLDELKNASAQKLVILNNQKYDYFADASGQMFVLSSSDGVGWTLKVLSGKYPQDVNTIQIFEGTFYGVSEGGVLVFSKDGVEWELKNTNLEVAFRSLAGNTSNRLFALCGDDIYYSYDAESWFKDGMDDSSDNLPLSNIAAMNKEMTFNKDFEMSLLSGMSARNEPVLWKKIVDNAGSNTESWSLYPRTSEIKYPLPNLSSACMFSYDDKLIYMGCLNDSVSSFYVSQDEGRNWIPNTTSYVHPYEMSAQNVGCAVDEDDFIWLLCAGTGQVWKGRLNRLSFATNQKSFTE